MLCSSYVQLKHQVLSHPSSKMPLNAFLHENLTCRCVFVTDQTPAKVL